MGDILRATKISFIFFDVFEIHDNLFSFFLGGGGGGGDRWMFGPSLHMKKKYEYTPSPGSQVR